MDNKKIATLLRSVADVFEQNVEGDIKTNLLKSVMDIIEDEKKNIENKVKETKDKVTLDNALKLMRKIEENDKIQVYKDKLKEVQPKFKTILSDLDRTREEIMEKHLKEFKLGIEPKDILSVIPNAKEYKLPNGRTLEDVLSRAKDVQDLLNIKGKMPDKIKKALLGAKEVDSK